MNRIGPSGIAPILQHAARLSYACQLSITNEEDTFRTLVEIKAGKIIDVRPEKRPSAELLGERLVRQGVLSKAELKRALALHKKGQGRIGEVLLDAGVVTTAQVQTAVDVQSLDALYALFDLRSGSYEESSCEGLERRHTMTPISVEGAISEGFRRAESWPLIRARPNNYGIVLQRSQGGGDATVLEGDPGYILPLVDGKKSVRALVEASGLGEFRTLKALTVLLVEIVSRLCAIRGIRTIPWGDVAAASFLVWPLPCGIWSY